MYGVVLMMALTSGSAGAGGVWAPGYAPGVVPLPAYGVGPAYAVGVVPLGWGEGWGGALRWGWGTPAGTGYGPFYPVHHTCCGVVLPPVPSPEETGKGEFMAWKLYVDALEGDERHEMMCLWMRADGHARHRLLMNLAHLRRRLQEDEEREKAREKEMPKDQPDKEGD